MRIPPIHIVLGAALLLALPLIPGISGFTITLAGYIGLASLVAIGLVLLTGVGGMTSFGQAAFVGFGAYTSAVLTTKFGFSPWLTLPVSLFTAGGLAYVIGLLTVRLSGHFLPLGTIAWGISFYYLFGNIAWFGGHDGIGGIRPLQIGAWHLIDSRAIYYPILLAVVLVVYLSRNLLDSRIGRSIRALRGGSTAAEAFGIDTARAKLTIFVYSALLAGLSGWLYAHVQRAVSPSPFGLNAGIEFLLMAVLGGSGYILGGVLGAAIVILLKDQLQNILPKLIGADGNFETIFFGILMVAVLQLAKDGLWPYLARLFPKTPDRVIDTEAAALSQRQLPTNGTPLLEVKNLRKTFGGLVAVNDVNFSLRAGEIIGLIGPNGAGKSTTFNLLTGVLKATSGEVSYLGTRIEKLPSREIAKLGIARSFQHVKLVPHMSLLENVALGAHLRGEAGVASALLRLNKAEEARLFAEAAKQIERVGLSEHMHKPAGSLALGQQRLVEIARALCLDPALLLLDEPAAGLRYGEKQALAALLTRLKGQGVSVLLVEHDMDFVMNLTDHLVVLVFGQKIAEGTPAEIRVNKDVIAAYLGGDAV